ncbi:hypothetical protein [Demequina capsici]|uniref:Uncharacterized protein n=1 Tax=Demequina capsici TaxID=3075620 RepID=A0AA96J8N3_9MICO|nr:hypothetical protein [Demequina sp. OYTSA14]WNM25243.1 hypothetical protein RN606_03590 [Demequina sp. OYTSA14]
MRISVFESAPLQGVILALRGVDREVAAQLRKATRQVVEPVWRREVAQQAHTRLEVKVLSDTARASVSSANVTLKAGTLARKTSSGTPAWVLAMGAEFGGYKSTRYLTISKRGKQFKQRLGTRFKRPNHKGYVVYQAAAKAIPRIASLWAQTTVRTFHEIVEKGVR